MTHTGTADQSAPTCPVHAPALPFARETVVELAPQFHALRDQARAVRVLTPVGDPAWLITRYDDVKALYDDDRLVRSHPNPDAAAKLSYAAILGGPEGNHDSERADHARMRGAATAAFSARRMNALRPRIERIAEELIGAIAAGTPPADLHPEFTLPLSVRVICELLGVPYEDRDRFGGWFNSAMSPDAGGAAETGRASLGELFQYLGQLVERKRADPGNDFISHVTRTDGLRNNDIQIMVAGLLFAGHHATMSFMDVGIARLLCSPRQVSDLLADESLVDCLAEEVLRSSAPGLGVTPRYARSDIQLGDVTIAAGDAVLLSFAAANHDREVFPDPDEFIARRSPNPHLAFGYGRHFCIGAGLARIELQVGLGRLFRRLPTLRLAVPTHELRFGREFMNAGLVALPVVW